MDDPQNKLARRSLLLKELGFSDAAVSRNLVHLVQQLQVKKLARKAFDAGIPVDQGPVWFEEEAWRNKCWVEQWHWQKAYREGWSAREEFQDISSNPYVQEEIPFSELRYMQQLAWRCGFKGIEQH